MPENDALWRVLHANFPGLAWPPAVAAQLPALMPLRRLASGRSLFVQGQRPSAFYAVVSGEIENRFTGVDGRVSVIAHVGAPRLFGLAAFAARQPSEYEAVARGPVEVLAIGREAYRLLMDDPDATVRAACIKALGAHGTVDDALLIIPRLKDEAAFVRWQAAKSLQRIHHEQAVGPLLDAMKSDEDVDVRMAAADALGQYPRPAVFDALAR